MHPIIAFTAFDNFVYHIHVKIEKEKTFISTIQQNSQIFYGMIITFAMIGTSMA